jgi:hypothetical protein
MVARPPGCLVVALLAGCGGAELASDAAAIDGAAGDGRAGDGPAGDGQACAVACASVRFSGRGETHGDRIRFRLDDPATVAAGPLLDVGATDFTIELWLRGAAADNPNAIACGPGLGWTSANIVVDRDRHSQAPAFGVGLQSGRAVFAVVTAAGALSMCGTRVIADDRWHHLAVDRRRGDGRLRIWVDGALDVAADGPDGDVAYPDDGVPSPTACPRGSCIDSDPFLVLGAEKHGYPGISFTGWVTELRVSTRLRYDATFAPPRARFVTDAATVGLYHLDDGAGTVAADRSGQPGAVDGELIVGGEPPSPTWSASSPF